MKSLVLAILMAAAGAACARTVAELPDPRVRSGRVSDVLGQVTDADEQAIHAACVALERETGVQLAAAVIDRTDGRSPKEFATALFNAWALGDRTRNDGVLLLVVMDARRAEVEVGRGLNDRMPSQRLAELVQTELTPRMRAGDVSGGVRATMQALDRLARELKPGRASAAVAQTGAASPSPAKPTPARQTPTPPDNTILAIAILGAAFIFICWLVLLPYRFIRRLIARRPPKCESCWIAMTRLSEQESEPYLDPAQLKERELGAAKHEVFRCGGCRQTQVRSGSLESGYLACPQCQRVTASKTSRVLSAATEDDSGSGETITSCSHCGFRAAEPYTISRRRRRSSSNEEPSPGSSGGGSSDGRGGGGASW